MTGIGQYVVRYDEETGELDRAGVVTPKGSKIVAHTNHHRAGSLLVAKIAGSHYYGGQGQPQNYAPARFELYYVIREEGDGWMLVEPIADWPVRG